MSWSEWIHIWDNNWRFSSWLSRISIWPWCTKRSTSLKNSLMASSSWKAWKPVLRRLVWLVPRKWRDGTISNWGYSSIYLDNSTVHELSTWWPLLSSAWLGKGTSCKNIRIRRLVILSPSRKDLKAYCLNYLMRRMRKKMKLITKRKVRKIWTWLKNRRSRKQLKRWSCNKKPVNNFFLWPSLWYSRRDSKSISCPLSQT